MLLCWIKLWYVSSSPPGQYPAMISTNKIGGRRTQANPVLFYLRVIKLGPPQFGAEISEVVRNS